MRFQACGIRTAGKGRHRRVGSPVDMWSLDRTAALPAQVSFILWLGLPTGDDACHTVGQTSTIRCTIGDAMSDEPGAHLARANRRISRTPGGHFSRDGERLMNILSELRGRFAVALDPLAADTTELVDLVRPSQDAKFGDYQANCAMPLGKKLGRSPREVATEIVSRLTVDDLCEPPQIAGPGFINLRLREDYVARQVEATCTDERLGVEAASEPKTFIIDYSSPNVAKPMHVGHIRSTVIGDSLYRVLSFLGHRVIGDNHIGDWGTQFGMIIYGYRHFVDGEAYANNPVAELARLYRLVSRLVDYHVGRRQVDGLTREVQTLAERVERERQGGEPADRKAAKARRKLEAQLAEGKVELGELQESLAAVETDTTLGPLAHDHSDIAEAVLQETARLHAGDEKNVKLWREFLPACRAEIDRVFARLGVRFDHTLGESFYHDRLAAVVVDLESKGIARQSDGALCVFLEGHATPMIVRKKDGAYLYSTTDLATIQYRMHQWRPDTVLYVIDHRQHLHCEQLFAAARLWGFDDVELVHVSFGTVLGDDNRPFKTRAGDTVGLEGLLDEAVRRARKIVSENDDAKAEGPQLSETERDHISEVVGIAAIKYADLAQNRTSDYVFSYDKMLAMNGNTATYMQYAYARVRSIFARGGVDVEAWRGQRADISLGTPAERALALAILRFSEALELVVADYRPNQLTAYLFELANCYSTFFDQCPVLKAETPKLRESRLRLCDLTARVLKQGLSLLGIDVVEQM